MTKFILFDIDGTLIDSGGAGVRALDLAFREMFSIRDAFRTISMAGKTDLGILREGLGLHGVEDSEAMIPAFFDLYIAHLKEQMPAGGGHIKTGIREALEALPDEGYALGLLTGNIEEGAWIKLRQYGLDTFFGTGAFGSDSEDRNKLLPVAVDKLFRESSRRVGYGDCVIVGDTPRDIQCAKPHGDFAIGVATGPFSSHDLHAAGADAVFEDLSDTASFISTLREITGRSD